MFLFRRSVCAFFTSPTFCIPQKHFLHSHCLFSGYHHHPSLLSPVYCKKTIIAMAPKRTKRSQLTDDSEHDMNSMSTTKGKKINKRRKLTPSTSENLLQNREDKDKEKDEAVDSSVGEDDCIINGKNEQKFFLMKSEPESRIQNGHEMKFSIDDLIAEPQSTTHWDGVRNYEARNIMKEMRTGDHAFFYHSNSKKSKPTIVGQVEIVREAYPDHTAFDKSDPHYDPKSSKEKPRWFMVDVKFIKKFKNVVTLDQIKKCDQLANMQLVKRGRISVQRVTADEWRTVMAMTGEDEENSDENEDDDGSDDDEGND